MMNRMHNDPEADVEIASAYRGDIRCRKLVVTASGSIVGNVEAVDVRNHGRVHGVVNASAIFINNDGARFRGSVFAPHIGTHLNSKLEGSTSNSQPFETDGQMSPLAPSAINMAVQEGIRRELARRGFGADDQGFAVSENTTFARADREPARASSKSQTPFRTADGNAFPVPENAEPLADVAWAPPIPSRRVEVEGREYFQVSATGFDTDGTIGSPDPIELAKAPSPRAVPTPRALPPLFASGK